jgi:predicted nucleic acid-binding protein
MKKYLLDTLVILSFIEGKDIVLNKIKNISHKYLYISAPQCAELFTLINDAYSKKVFEGLVANLNVLDFDIEAARVFGTLKGNIISRGCLVNEVYICDT